MRRGWGFPGWSHLLRWRCLLYDSWLELYGRQAPALDALVSPQGGVPDLPWLVMQNPTHVDSVMEQAAAESEPP